MRPSRPARSSQASDPADSRKIRVTLVHGTWARGILRVRERPRFASASSWWFNPGSEFRRRLEPLLQSAGLTVELQQHAWSGANSIHARAAAADALADMLVQQSRTDPEAAHVIIAHSHGGNVALRAADKLSDDGVSVRVVTLATPFLRIAERAAGWAHMMVFLFAIPLFMGPTILVVQWLERTLPRWSAHATGIAVFLLLSLLARWLTWNEQRRKQLIAASNFRSGRNTQVLVLRGFMDEASLSLAFGAIGAEMTHLIFSTVMLPTRVAVRIGRSIAETLLRPLVKKVAREKILPTLRRLRDISIFMGGLGIVGWLISLLPPVEDLSRRTGSAWLVWIALPWLMIVLLVLGGAFLALHGRELFGHALGLLVTTDSVPDAQSRVDVLTLKGEETLASGLRHGLYNYPECAGIVAHWIVHGEVNIPPAERPTSTT